MTQITSLDIIIPPPYSAQNNARCHDDESGCQLQVRLVYITVYLYLYISIGLSVVYMLFCHVFQIVSSPWLN